MSDHPLHRFHGGLELPGHKALSNTTPLAELPLPTQLVLPLSQHIGEPAEPLVRAGERVLGGQALASAHGYVSVPLHAPTSGRIREIRHLPVPHPSGLTAPCLVLEPDGADAWVDPTPVSDAGNADPALLRQALRSAGIVGLGGAGFPSFIKDNASARRPIHTLILNGAECEPYISCDDLLMRSRPQAVIEGARLLRHIVGASTVLIGVEDNKPEALAALQAVADADMTVVSVPTRYPTGGEKQLIQVLTGLEVPSQGLPAAIGVLCHNVGTAAAVADALLRGRPLTHRIVTVSGRGVSRPGNLQVPLGALFSDLVAACGGYQGEVARLILGGPMMGFALGHDQVPVIKTSNCLLVAAPEEVAAPTPPLPCIRCGACVEVCPAQLLPQQLYWHAAASDFDKVQDYHLFDCIECGCCAQVCPSAIPLVQHYRYAKTEIWEQERERSRADRARERHEERLARLEREQAERAARLAARKRAVADKPKAQAGGDVADPKQAAIQAALARVQARKAAQAQGERAAPSPASTAEPQE